MEARILIESDYPKLVQWWEDNRFPAPPINSLPNNGTGGFMVSNDDGEEICAGFLYTTNSSIAWIEFIVADFNYRKDDRANAIVYLIESLKLVATQLGYKSIFTSVKNKGLIRKYEVCGFKTTDSNAQEMIINLE